MLKKLQDALRHPLVAGVLATLLAAAIIAAVKPMRGVAITAGVWTWKALHHPVPMWSLVAMAAFVLFLSCVLWTRSQRLREFEFEKLNAVQVRPTRAEPELVAVWEGETCRCGYAMYQGVERTFLVGRAHLSMRNGVTNYSFVQASVNGSAFSTIERIHVRRAEANHANISIVVIPPIGTVGEPLEATIVFRDNFGKEFALTPYTFPFSTYPPPYR